LYGEVDVEVGRATDAVDEANTVDMVDVVDTADTVDMEDVVDEADPQR
jgi:hypothetical protein